MINNHKIGTNCPESSYSDSFSSIINLVTSGWVLCKREVCNFFPCSGLLWTICPHFAAVKASSRHYLRISLSFCQVDGQFSTNLTDHHGHWQKREVCHFFLWWWVTVSHCGQFAAIQTANLSPFVRLTFRDVWRGTPPSRRTVAALGLVETMLCRKASPLSFESWHRDRNFLTVSLSAEFRLREIVLICGVNKKLFRLTMTQISAILRLSGNACSTQHML